MSAKTFDEWFSDFDKYPIMPIKNCFKLCWEAATKAAEEKFILIKLKHTICPFCGNDDTYSSEYRCVTCDSWFSL